MFSLYFGENCGPGEKIPQPLSSFHIFLSSYQTKESGILFSFRSLFSILPKTPLTKHIVKFISQFISLNKLWITLTLNAMMNAIV